MPSGIRTLSKGSSAEAAADGSCTSEDFVDLRELALKRYANLPNKVKKRVLALKKLQLKHYDIEAEFYKQMNLLELEFHTKYLPLFEKRTAILTGDVEPTDEECVFEHDVLDDTGDVAGLCQDFEENAQIVNEAVMGIPEFWLTVLKNVPDTAVLLQQHDYDVLKYLYEVKCELVSDPINPGFVLIFKFKKNPHFLNQCLTKEYDVKFEAIGSPFEYEGPEIVKSKGCTIDWLPNMNTTVQIVKKKVRNKKSGERKTITKEISRESFFNFFRNETKSIDQYLETGDEAIPFDYSEDFHIGQLFRERIIPRAVLYYTGEGIEEDDETDSNILLAAQSDESLNENDTSAEKSPLKGLRGGRNSKGAKDSQDCKQQ